jgi:hypothetical protein
MTLREERESRERKRSTRKELEKISSMASHCLNIDNKLKILYALCNLR